MVRRQAAHVALEHGFLMLARARQVALLLHRDGEVQARSEEVGMVRGQGGCAMLKRHGPSKFGCPNGPGSDRRKAEHPRRIRNGLAPLETLYVSQRSQRPRQHEACLVGFTRRPALLGFFQSSQRCFGRSTGRLRFGRSHDV